MCAEVRSPRQKIAVSKRQTPTCVTQLLFRTTVGSHLCHFAIPTTETAVSKVMVRQGVTSLRLVKEEGVGCINHHHICLK